MQKSPKFVDLLYQNHFFTNCIFFVSTEMEEICMNILIYLFGNRPVLIDKQIVEKYITNSSREPNEIIILMSKYVEKLPVLQISLPIINEFLSIYQTLNFSQYIVPYLQMISFAFSKNKVLAKSLEYKMYDILSFFFSREDPNISIECYKIMLIPRNFQFQVPEDLLSKHIIDDGIRPLAIKYLALSDYFPYSYNFVSYLLQFLSQSTLIPKIIIKAALTNQSIAISISRDPSWMVPCKFNQNDACSILMGAMRFTQSIEYLAANQSFPPLLTYIATSNESQVLIYLSQILILFSTSQEAVRIFTVSETLNEFLNHCGESNDQNVHMASLNVLDACLRFDFCPAFTSYIPKLVDMLRYQNNLTTRAIIVIVTMSNFPEGAAALKSVGLENYFENLTQMPNYSTLADTFLNNIK